MSDIYVTVQDVLEAGRAAFERVRLQAQQPDQIGRSCKYRSATGSHPCLVGAALSDEQAEYADKHLSGVNLWPSRFAREKDLISGAQICHDEAMGTGERGFNSIQFAAAVLLYGFLYKGRTEFSADWVQLAQGVISIPDPRFALMDYMAE